MFRGAPEFNPALHVPVLDAVIASATDAILIAPTDTTPLVEQRRRAHEAGIAAITLDTFGHHGVTLLPVSRSAPADPAMPAPMPPAPWPCRPLARWRATAILTGSTPS